VPVTRGFVVVGGGDVVDGCLVVFAGGFGRQLSGSAWIGRVVVVCGCRL